MRLLIFALALMGCHHNTGCKEMPCPMPCGSVGYKTDPQTGCRLSCQCNGTPTPCPQLTCPSTCGLDVAHDLVTGCPTCTCCNPADCEPGGCHTTETDGCPGCTSC